MTHSTEAIKAALTPEEWHRLVRDACHEAFTEGMREHTSSHGGNPWTDSRTKKKADAALDRRAASPETGWRDIASDPPPKDGTRILLGRFVKGDKYDGRQRVDWYRTDAAKSGYTGFGEFNDRFWPATHWQPLPPAPAASNDGGETR